MIRSLAFATAVFLQDHASRASPSGGSDLRELRRIGDLQVAQVVRYVDGVLPEEQRRSGGFRSPAPREPYVWEGLQGTVLTAELLTRAGYEPWSWEDQALRRAVSWLDDVNDYPAEGDDRWIPWVVNARVGTDFPTESPTRPGKSTGFSDWALTR